MLKIVLTIFVLIQLTRSESFCPYPFTNSHNGYTFNNCYYFAGRAIGWRSAQEQCKTLFPLIKAPLIAPRDQSRLDDLYPLAKAYNISNFWVNAYPGGSSHVWLDYEPMNENSYVSQSSFCRGEPRSKYDCGYYTTYYSSGSAVDKCISTTLCSSVTSWYGVFCQYYSNPTSF